MIVAFVQARMSSTRLPGKVLLPVDGQSMLERLLARLGRAQTLDRIVVLTSEESSDEPIFRACKSLGVDTFRGDLDDVLDRFYQAAQKYDAKTIVRITGDCPLIDPDVVDSVVDVYQTSNVDYASNTIPPSFPDGLDVEVFSRSALEESWRNARLISHREHVTLYIKDHPEQFRLKNVVHAKDLSQFRLTVDEPEDYDLVCEIFTAFSNTEGRFSLVEIMEYLASKAGGLPNQNINRDEGLLASRCRDALNFEPRIEKSLAVCERAKQCIPGATQLLSKRANQFSEGVWPGYYSRAKGAHVWDMDGNCYLDMSIGGIGATILGYADPDVDAAVIDAIQSGVASSLSCPEEVEFSEFICGLHPWSSMARLARTGGEAMAIAVRLARAYTRREKVLICGYHGWHDWYLAVNLVEGDPLKAHLLPGLDALGVPKSLAGTSLSFRYNDLEELERLLRENTGEVAAIVMEPMRSELPNEGFLEGVRHLADQHGSQLVFDEVSSGFRFCSGGAHLDLGVNPDVAVFSKSIANGYAMAALIGTSEVMCKAEETFISSTCWTEKIGPVAALATLRKFIQQDVSGHLNDCGEQVRRAWIETAERFALPIQVSGQNPISSFTLDVEDFPAAKALFVQIMLSQGILASNSFYAMYSHQASDIERYVSALEIAFKVLADALQAGDVSAKLKGAPAVPGFGRLVK
jgi:glutamate-1-semialdehyde 2,1-aminomutase